MLKLNGDVLAVELPEGKTQQELVGGLADNTFTKTLYGLDLKVNGRITTGMAMMLGHKLAHICKAVSIFDPKLNDYIRVIWH
jgi:hypothetical protein